TYTTQSGKSNYAWSVTGTIGTDYIITSGGTPGDNNLTLKWLSTGSKTVTVNYTGGGCSGITPASKTITVNANAMITVQPVSPAPMCAGSGSANLGITALGASAYQWQVSTDNGSTWTNLSNAGSYTSVNTATMTITSPAASLDNGKYRCMVTGSCGVATSFSATLTVNSTNIDSQLTSGQTQCINGSFSPISVTASGSGLTYQWYSNTVSSNTGGTSLGTSNGAQTGTFTPMALVAGTAYYYCVVTGTCGFSTSAVSGAFTVTPENTITLSTGNNIQTKCINTAIIDIGYTTSGATGLSFTGLPAGVSGIWSAGNATISGTPTSSGTFNYTVTTLGGCGNKTAAGTITVNPVPNADISISETSGTTGNDGTICNGDAAALTASGGISYTWTPATGLNNVNTSNPIASPVTTTTYQVTVTDINGCINTANTLITVVPKVNTGEMFRKPNR
ncbi:MAG: hypothetical protein HC905_00680, partial [Bacteroidales bacterium]|nr:hypothetical protein [Bacteroidales bacterium]